MSYLLEEETTKLIMLAVEKITKFDNHQLYVSDIKFQKSVVIVLIELIAENCLHFLVLSRDYLTLILKDQ